MTIVEFIPQLGVGGAERFTVDLCNELAKQNEVYLLVSHDLTRQDYYTKEISDKVHVMSFKKRSGIDYRLFFKVYKTIKTIKPEIVHSHLTSVVYVALCCILYRTPKYFHTVHNSAKEEGDGKIGRLFRRFLFKARLINPITISNESKRSFVEYYGLDAPVIWNGRDVPSIINVSEGVKREVNACKLTKDTKVIVQLAHVGYQKHQDVMARVVCRLVEEGFDIVVLMIGTHDEQRMVDYIRELSCERIHLLGVKANPLEYLAESDAFGLTSSYEGLPISLIEAMGVGVIPICTPVGGIIDVIKDGENGFLSSSIQDEDYYIALKRYLMLSPREDSIMRAKVRKSYKAYTMRACAMNYLKIFKNVANIR